MNSLLIANALLDGSKCDILIEGNRFARIAPAGVGLEAERILDAEGKAVLPALYNTHTHAAMTLLRGYADDMALGKWLSEYIWPFEDKLTPANILDGSRHIANYLNVIWERNPINISDRRHPCTSQRRTTMKGKILDTRHAWRNGYCCKSATIQK